MVASLSVSHSDFLQEIDVIVICWEYLQEDANLQEGAAIAALLSNSCEDDDVTQIVMFP